MSGNVVQELATKKSDQASPPIERNRAVSVMPPFAMIKPLLAGYPPPRRPNRTRPLPLESPELRDELDAWEAASDEAYESMEDGLSE